MPKLRNFLALDGSDRIATFEAMAELVWANALVQWVQPRHWHTRFGSIGALPGDAPDIPSDLATVRRMRLAVARARRNIPTNANCLPQALAARRMLARRGIASQLYLGSLRDDGGTMRIHAWLKVGSEWVSGQCDESRYALFDGAEAQRA